MPALPDVPSSDLAIDVADLHRQVLRWYATNARDLPWRAGGTPPWHVLVSEVMLQQTPVVRVLPAWTRWCERWPTPAALAAEPPGEAVRAWDRLGYPRRALRLHAAAVAVVERHDGAVPADVAALRALPGVGAYTAAAVASFAFGQRHAVLDTNVRRVLARCVRGIAAPAPAVTRAEAVMAESLLPENPDTAARWAVAVMELGALVCTSRSPRCGSCPLADACAWRAAGSPAYDGPRRTQAWAGTDRQARGTLLGAARAAAPEPATPAAMAAAWPQDAVQRERALRGLVADGLLAPAEPPAAGWALPGVGRDVRHFVARSAQWHA